MSSAQMRPGIICVLALMSAIVAGCSTSAGKQPQSLPSNTETDQPHGLVYSIPVPHTTLVLEFPSDGFKLEVSDDNPPYYYFTNAQAKLNMSFSFERATKCRTSESCRDYFVKEFNSTRASKKIWQISRLGEIFISETSDDTVVDSSTHSSTHSSTSVQYLNAHFVKDSVWINLRLSKTGYRPSDRAFFLRLIQSIKFWPKVRE